jgi:hypothetical protein
MLTGIPMQLVDTATTQTPAQVFVHDERATGQADQTAGPHDAGLRAPRPDDDAGQPIFDATGNPLYFTLEKWRAAGGGIDLAPDSDGAPGDRVSLAFHRLIAFGHYSVFIRTDATDGPHFAPLDGSGITNNFDAHVDGAANVTISTPQHLAAGVWIVAIYHSDAQDHGNSPGDFTHSAFQQLIVKLP